jgi:tetratricopeptide (TPR) repeat protein
LSVALVGLLGALAGCDGLDARKAVQEGNFHYKEGHFEKSKELFELALRKEPGLLIAHHNLGLTCAKLFKPGYVAPADLPEAEQKQLEADNQGMADCAAEHIQIYLTKYPKENKLRDKMTSLWLAAGLYDRALKYWQEQFQNVPATDTPQAQEAQKREIMLRIAGIYFKDQKWRESMEHYDKAAELASEPAAKVTSYQSIGNVAWATMRNREKNYGTDRIEAADRGLAALEKAAAIDPKKPDIRALVAALYNFRALAQGSAWAAAIERATAQDHDRRRRVLSEEAKKAQAAAAAAPTQDGASATQQPSPTAKPGG